ncbi:DUF983 domain-containing protein [Sphingomonas carotinifaciens]|nr:hypothetical protein [Sphingomonas carotinifaciens]
MMTSVITVSAPNDGPAFFSLRIVAFIVVWIQGAFEAPWWVHLLTSLPLMLAGCLVPLRPIKGWLVVSQYMNRAQEAGTGGLRAKLHGREAVVCRMRLCAKLAGRTILGRYASRLPRWSGAEAG